MSETYTPRDLYGQAEFFTSAASALLHTLTPNGPVFYSYEELDKHVVERKALKYTPSDTGVSFEVIDSPEDIVPGVVYAIDSDS